MTTTMKRCGIALMAGVLIAAAAPARAQDSPRIEFGIGYAYLHDDQSDENLPKGFVLSLAGHVLPWIALVGEIGGNTKSVEIGRGDVSGKFFTFMAGPRVSTPVGAPVGVFGQLLFGAAHRSLEAGFPNVSLAVSDTHPALQLGAGLDLNFSPNAGIRFQGDARGIRADDDTKRQTRFVIALVIRH